MKNFFNRIVGVSKKPTTVTEILSDFQTKIQQLQQVTEHRRAVATANDEQIVNLHKQNQDHRIEADKANSVAGKLQSLLA